MNETMTDKLYPIDIQVASRYLPEQSSPEDSRFVFAYTVTITNGGTEAVRLLNRHWLITDAYNHIQEVRGEGVIGEQPLIEAGDAYQYTSGAMLETAVGTMEGSYEMISSSGRTFIAPIAVFPLIQPGVLH